MNTTNRILSDDTHCIGIQNCLLTGYDSIAELEVLIWSIPWSMGPTNTAAALQATKNQLELYGDPNANVSHQITDTCCFYNREKTESDSFAIAKQ